MPPLLLLTSFGRSPKPDAAVILPCKQSTNSSRNGLPLPNIRTSTSSRPAEENLHSPLTPKISMTGALMNSSTDPSVRLSSVPLRVHGVCEHSLLSLRYRPRRNNGSRSTTVVATAHFLEGTTLAHQFLSPTWPTSFSMDICCKRRVNAGTVGKDETVVSFRSSASAWVIVFPCLCRQAARPPLLDFTSVKCSSSPTSVSLCVSTTPIFMLGAGVLESTGGNT
mmetsp:Transcript_13934/g.33719  ORF Transcript_13934/g.33719 Transcript_13934/m.33719 type:complete len:223 (+) Transcript_13934:492-1160(+)